MNYTHDWNQEFKNNTQSFGKFDLCLEIGCFEGLTSNYICDNLLKKDGKLLCVDPLTDTYLNDKLTENDVLKNQTDWSYFNKQYERFISNTSHQGHKIELFRCLSSDAFPQLLDKYKNCIDLVYIDGDHRASAVYLDAINSFELVKSDGLIIFDDYSWGSFYNEESTSVGINRFLEEYSNKIELIKKNYQIVIRKK